LLILTDFFSTFECQESNMFAPGTWRATKPLVAARNLGPGRRGLFVALGFCAALSSRSSAQGGWRQWDIHLRDGRRVEANPLGAPDTTRVSVSVGGYEGHDSTYARSRVDYIAARRSGGQELPPPPMRRACADLIVRRDGRKSTGRVTLTRIMYSEGVVRQRGVDVDLKDVAYIKFASSSRKGCGHSRT
jgi:hypothetical protein